MSRTEKKSFFDLYAEQKKKPTPAQNFIAEIAALTIVPRIRSRCGSAVGKSPTS